MPDLDSIDILLGSDSEYERLSNTPLRNTIHQLLDEISAPCEVEQRAHARTPDLFTSSLRMDVDVAWRPIYVRDISEGGVGFVSGTQFDLGIGTVEFQTESNVPVCLRVNITWQRALNEHWFISGGPFIGLSGSSQFGSTNGRERNGDATKEETPRKTQHKGRHRPE